MSYYLLPTFKFVSVAFAFSAVSTGAQALLSPIKFADGFGLPITRVSEDPDIRIGSANGTTYVSLMGIRQLATGLTLITFAYQRKWVEAATILSILGIVVAGTDGRYLSKAGRGGQARFHAIPGALIAMLSAAVVIEDARK